MERGMRGWPRQPTAVHMIKLQRIVVTVDTKTNVPVQPQPFPSAKHVAVSANQTLDFEAICVLTTDLPDSTVHRCRRYRRTTTSKQAISISVDFIHRPRSTIMNQDSKL